MRRNWMFIVPAALVGMVLFIFIGGEIVHLLWNWLLPPMFGLRQITFWERLGILALCRILFGKFGLHGGRHGYRGREGADRMVDRMADRVAERFEAMTPEQRERFRQRLRERCGIDPATSESKGQ